MTKETMQKIIEARAKIMALKAQQEDANGRLQKTEDITEARALGETLKRLADELKQAEADLAAAEKEGEQDENPPAPDSRSFNPNATFGTTPVPASRATTEALSTMEYRRAFMEYVQAGKPNAILKRAEAEQVSADLGILLPNTIVNEIIKGVEKVYGQLYARVKKSNVKGGVQYPIGSFTATMHWDGTTGTDTEHGVSEKQKAGGITGYIQFTYHIGEIRIAQSLLQSVVSVEAFEREIVNALVSAYVQAMDEAILVGDGVHQPTGILTEAAKGDSRIPATNIITMSAADMADWKQWQKKLFAKIPLSMRSLRPVFVMTAETWESNIMTLEDGNGRPVYRETYNPETGDEKATFKGREVVFVEEGGLKPFDTAATGEYFGIMLVPERAYLINSNMQFSYRKYFDESTNQYITKALVICDGKVLDPKYIYLLKKGASSAT